MPDLVGNPNCCFSFATAQLSNLIIVSELCPYPMPDVTSSSIKVTVNPEESGPNEPWQALKGSDLGYPFKKKNKKITIRLNPKDKSETDYVAFKVKNVNVNDIKLKVTNEETMETFVLTFPVSLFCFQPGNFLIVINAGRVCYFDWIVRLLFNVPVNSFSFARTVKPPVGYYWDLKVLCTKKLLKQLL